MKGQGRCREGQGRADGSRKGHGGPVRCREGQGRGR